MHRMQKKVIVKNYFNIRKAGRLQKTVLSAKMALETNPGMMDHEPDFHPSKGGKLDHKD